MDYGECLSVIQNHGEINMRSLTHIWLSLVRLAIIQLPRLNTG
jgi:hypothetical protein